VLLLRHHVSAAVPDIWRRPLIILQPQIGGDDVKPPPVPNAPDDVSTEEEKDAEDEGGADPTPHFERGKVCRAVIGCRVSIRSKASQWLAEWASMPPLPAAFLRSHHDHTTVVLLSLLVPLRP
jgi:hypothetical protein